MEITNEQMEKIKDFIKYGFNSMTDSDFCIEQFFKEV